MKKDELLNELDKLSRFEISVGVLDFMSETAVKLNHVLALVEQLDEPEKVVVPQFVADEFDYKKRTCYQVDESKSVAHILRCAFGNGGKPSEFLDWVRENPEEYVMAVKNGCVAEKEKGYYAKIRGHEFINAEVILDDDTGEDVSEWNRHIYFIQQMDGNVVLDMKNSGLRGARHFMSIKDWEALGITVENAEFEEVP